MKGYPKIIATKSDIEYLMGYLGSPLATAENKNKGLAFLNSLLNTKVYQFDKILVGAELPTGTEPDYKVLDGQGENNNERHQFVLAEDVNAKIHKLGLSVIEVQNYISTVGAA